MQDFADLELSLNRLEGNSYAVGLRLRLPGSEVDTEPGSGVAAIDLDLLHQAETDPQAYGKQLSDSLFSDAAVRAGFKSARDTAQSSGLPLRLRLFIGPRAPELHTLRWETLYDPETPAPLLQGQNLLFSRYLTSPDARKVRLRPQGELRALIAIANPSDLASYQLAPVDVGRELELIKGSLGGIAQTVLAGGDRKVTLNNLIEAIDRVDPVLVYLVCHGAAKDGETWLILENETGAAAFTGGAEIINRLRDLNQLPHLVILAACQSASDTGAGLLSALGPRLAESGVPAVIAMQDKISMETSAGFMQVFFNTLQQDGQIDLAMSTARANLSNRPDFWMPALFMRLRSGRIWYTPGFSTAFDKWEALLSNIETGRCTPILGSGLSDRLLGPQRLTAQRWAETFRYPMYPHEREALPQVAQFLAIKEDEYFPRNELVRYLRKRLQDRFSDSLSPDLLKPGTNLGKLMIAVHNQFYASSLNPDTEAAPTFFDPYKLLAELPLPIYITTNLHQILEAKLKEAGKDPQTVLSPWNDYVKDLPSVFLSEPDYTPTPERPLVYHLFGILDEEDSVVLTEDDYFKYLIGMATNHKDIPPAVSLALTRTALLFLGFQLDDWNFRVLYHGLLAYGGSEARKQARFAHIAAQVEPEEGRLLDDDSARSYLEKYFGGAFINLYWGSPDDFLRTLSDKLTERAQAEAAG